MSQTLDLHAFARTWKTFTELPIDIDPCEALEIAIKSYLLCTQPDANEAHDFRRPDSGEDSCVYCKRGRRAEIHQQGETP